MRVLYVNHTGDVSGGELSLLDLLGHLPSSVTPLLATPDGPLARAADRLGVAQVRIMGTAGSLRLHPRHTPTALLQICVAALQVRRAARIHRADVIHANSIRAGIIVGLAFPTRGRHIVHARDCLPPGLVSTATLRFLAATAHTLVANSRYTGESITARAPRADVVVVYNGIDLDRWDPLRVDSAGARAALGASIGDRALLGVVAQLTPWKGQDTAIEALGLLRARGVDAHLLLIGSAKFAERATRLDNHAYVVGLRELADRAGVADRVSWLGEREDVPKLVGALDILLLPSREEPFGRAVIEAMAMRVPVIATAIGGPAEIITDGRDGLLAKPGEAAVWCEAIQDLLAAPQRAADMGLAARRAVQARFTVESHVKAMLDVYANVVGCTRLSSGAS